MELRDHEQRQLAEIERRLSAEDPKLAETLTAFDQGPLVGWHRIRFVLTMLAIDIAGAMTIVAGIHTSVVTLIVVGAMAMAVAAMGLATARIWRRDRARA